MRLIILISSLLLITSCGDKNKSEFMDGCTGGSTSDYAHKVCSCAYDKMKDTYGVRLENGKYPTLRLFAVQIDVDSA